MELDLMKVGKKVLVDNEQNCLTFLGKNASFFAL